MAAYTYSLSTAIGAGTLVVTTDETPTTCKLTSDGPTYSAYRVTGIIGPLNGGVPSTPVVSLPPSRPQPRVDEALFKDVLERWATRC